MTSAIPAILIGIVAGIIVVYAIEERPATALVLTFATLGAVLASAVRQSVKF